MKIYKGVLIIVCCFLLLGCQDNSNNRANRTPTDLDSDTEVETNEKTDKKEIADYKRDTNPGEVINITMDQMEEMIEKFQENRGFIKAMWCGDVACEEKIKEDTGVKSRCIPFHEEQIGDVCVCCGKPAKTMIVWGKAY